MSVSEYKAFGSIKVGCFSIDLFLQVGMVVKGAH